MKLGDYAKTEYASEERCYVIMLVIVLVKGFRGTSLLAGYAGAELFATH